MKSRIVLAFCATLLLTGMVSANTKFNGSVDNLWSNPDNWSEGLPDASDKIQMNGDTLCILDYDAGLIKNTALEGGGTTHLQLVDGAMLTVTDWTIIAYAGAPEEPHLLEVLGGVYNSEVRMKIGFKGYGKLVIDHSGTVNVNSQELGVGEDANGVGIVELRGGFLNLRTDRAKALRFRNGENATASMDFSGGTLTQAYSESREAYINEHIADGTITAYDGVGTVVVESIDDDDDPETADTLVVKGLHPRQPAPEDGRNILPGTLTLSWTVDEGMPVDVWFGTSPDLSQATLAVQNKVVTSLPVQVTPGERYYWAVDTYEGTETDPVWGPIFEFYVGNVAPEVKAADDVTTWIDNGSADAAIAATVLDADATTVAWTVVSEPVEGTAVFANADQAETTVTLGAVGTYVLQLEADDGELKGADTMAIHVFADSCLAAQSLPGYEPLVGDLDSDCDVDQDDIDLLMENWLKCVALGECDPNGL
jgi:hypothetical protein